MRITSTILVLSARHYDMEDSQDKNRRVSGVSIYYTAPSEGDAVKLEEGELIGQEPVKASLDESLISSVGAVPGFYLADFVMGTSKNARGTNQQTLKPTSLKFLSKMEFPAAAAAAGRP